MKHVSVIGTAFLAAALALPGCESQQATLYHLVPSAAEDAGQAAAMHSGLTLGLESIVIPPYLDRPQLVTRLAENQLRLELLDQWAEPLQANLSSLVADELRSLTGAKQVLRAPYRHPGEIDLRVGLEIIRFEGTRAGDCLLSAEWAISGKQGETLLRRRSRFTGSASGEGIPSVVTCLNGLLGELNQAIAEDVTTVAGR